MNEETKIKLADLIIENECPSILGYTNNILTCEHYKFSLENCIKCWAKALGEE